MKHVMSHDLSPDVAKKVAEKAFDAYRQRFADYNPTLTWKSDTKAEASFRAKGIHLGGIIDLRPGVIEFDMKVPFILRMFESRALEFLLVSMTTATVLISVFITIFYTAPDWARESAIHVCKALCCCCCARCRRPEPEWDDAASGFGQDDPETPEDMKAAWNGPKSAATDLGGIQLTEKTRGDGTTPPNRPGLARVDFMAGPDMGAGARSPVEPQA